MFIAKSTFDWYDPMMMHIAICWISENILFNLQCCYLYRFWILTVDYFLSTSCSDIFPARTFTQRRSYESTISITFRPTKEIYCPYIVIISVLAHGCAAISLLLHTIMKVSGGILLRYEKSLKYRPGLGFKIPLWPWGKIPRMLWFIRDYNELQHQPAQMAVSQLPR